MDLEVATDTGDKYKKEKYTSWKGGWHALDTSIVCSLRTDGRIISHLVREVLDHVTGVVAAVHTQGGSLWRFVLILLPIQRFRNQATIWNIALQKMQYMYWKNLLMLTCKTMTFCPAFMLDINVTVYKVMNDRSTNLVIYYQYYAVYENISETFV